jgi:hypothetical protein
MIFCLLGPQNIGHSNTDGSIIYVAWEATGCKIRSIWIKYPPVHAATHTGEGH